MDHLESVDLELSTSGNASMPVDVSKWGALYQLLGLCVAMFLGAFGSGVIPLSISMNQRQLKTFNCFGAGLLLGTGLAVIIPEGIHSLYENDDEHEHEHDHMKHGRTHEDVHEQSQFPEHMVIGWALIAGFLSMLLVDNVTYCGGLHSHTHSDDSNEHSHDYDYDDERRLIELRETVDPEAEVPAPNTNNSGSNFVNNAHTGATLTKQRTTVTIGLLIHSAADGIALGAAKAASSSSSHSLEIVVFLAIMMHKVPAAFGLAVYLKTSGLGATAIRKNLCIFAAAAPIGALVTFLLLHRDFFGIASMSSASVASCLLFSGGTFLYVSTVHILGELRGPHKDLNPKELFALCTGCFVPVILFSGHDHGH